MRRLAMNLILASTSPRRRDLLAAAGFRFDVRSSGADESFTPSDFSGPRSIVQALALRKARALSPAEGDAIILGADTMVEADNGEILGIPIHREEARRMLRLLSGATHRVHTGVAVIGGGRECVGADTATVQFRDLSETDIRGYLETGEADDKAGAYGYQGLGRELIERVDGNPETVIGLPIVLVRQLLNELEWRA